MDWMKNLAMFHQMREKAEEARSKERLDDYKMQIVRNLMQKNQMLGEIEKKLTRMEDGDDPVQQKIMDKISLLETAVTSRSTMRQEMGGTERKVNDMIDYMMYNMSVLQQMVNNVAQMQRMQHQNAQETNRIIQSLPQILANANFQSGQDVTFAKNRVKKQKKRIEESRESSSESDRVNKPKRKKTKKEMTILSHRLDGKKQGDNSQIKNNRDNKREPSQLPKLNIPQDKSQTRQDSIDSDEKIEIDQANKNQGRKDITPSNQNTPFGKSGQAGGTPLKTLTGQVTQHPLLARGQSGNTGLKSGINNPLADAASMSQQHTKELKKAEGEEEESSKFQESMNGDSMKVSNLGSQHNKTMHKDDSMVQSEGGKAQNKSALEKSKYGGRRESRMKSENRGLNQDITILNLLTGVKDKQNFSGNLLSKNNSAENKPILPPLEENILPKMDESPGNLSPIAK